MSHSLFTFAFHAYSLAAVAYLVFLVRPWGPVAALARVTTALGLLLHGAGLFFLLETQAGVLRGLSQGVSAVTFLVLFIYLVLDVFYRLPVLGSFLTPMALALWVPGLWLRDGPSVSSSTAKLLPVHITIAVLGMAAFALAAGVAVVYLLMERQVKGKRFGLLFTRLPSLQSLDEINRWLVLAGFIALSLTLVTGAFFLGGGGPFWLLRSREVVTAMVAWGLFAAVLTARTWAGWRGRRVAFLTMAGFCVLILCFVSSYGAGGAGGRTDVTPAVQGTVAP